LLCPTIRQHLRTEKSNGQTYDYRRRKNREDLIERRERLAFKISADLSVDLPIGFGRSLVKSMKEKPKEWRRGWDCGMRVGRRIADLAKYPEFRSKKRGNSRRARKLHYRAKSSEGQ